MSVARFAQKSGSASVFFDLDPTRSDPRDENMEEANTPAQDTHGPQPGRSILSGNVPAFMALAAAPASAGAPLRG
jgi:hypothetical protein